MNNIRVIYPGTFDPVTNGHIDLVKRTICIFGTIEIIVAENLKKKTLFSAEERIDMILESTKNLSGITAVTKFDGLITSMAENGQKIVLIRGLRAVSDFEYELQMAMMNRKLNILVETVFLMPNEKYTYLNSSLIKEVSSHNGDVSKFVTENVIKNLKMKFNNK